MITEKIPDLEHFEHVFGATKSENTAFLHIQHLHDPILGQHCIAPRPNAGPRRLVPEVPIPVGQQKHLVTNLEALPPSPHDKGVVDGDASDGVDALRSELAGLADEARGGVSGSRWGRRRRGRRRGRLSCHGEVGDDEGSEVVRGVEVGEGGVGKLVANRYGGGGGEAGAEEEEGGGGGGGDG